MILLISAVAVVVVFPVVVYVTIAGLTRVL